MITYNQQLALTFWSLNRRGIKNVYKPNKRGRGREGERICKFLSSRWKFHQSCKKLKEIIVFKLLLKIEYAVLD